MLKNLFAIFLLLNEVLLFVACSDYPTMDEDILAYHVYAQSPIELDDLSDEYIELVAKSYGIQKSDVKKIQKIVASKKSISKLKSDYEASLNDKVLRLLSKDGESAKKDFVVNVMTPYLDALSRNEPYRQGFDREILEQNINELFERYFNHNKKTSILRNFMQNIYRFNQGGYANTDILNDINNELITHGLYIDWNPQSNLNILKIERVILAPTLYKNSHISILNLKRIVPSLMPSKLGYYTAGSNQVVVLDDMVDFDAEEKLKEIEQGKHFNKYTDKRFEKFWHSIGLDLNLEKANKIYRSLLKKDYVGKKKKFIKESSTMEVALHEAKHIADKIEHPELTLNIDAEFSAHVTAAIYSLAPRMALYSTISRMEGFAMYHRLQNLNDIIKKLWQLAIKSANEELFTEDSLHQSLTQIYNDYRTIREREKFELLDKFNNEVVNKIFHSLKIEKSF